MKKSTRQCHAALIAALCGCFLASPGLTQSIDDGKKLFEKHSCTNCHMLKGKGGLVGPPLDGLGKHRDESYIVYKLTVHSLPRRKKLFPVPSELMAHVQIPKADAAAIARYLRSLPAEKYKVQGHGEHVADKVPGGLAFVPEKKTASSTKGSILFKEKGCFACHSVDGFGGSQGPELQGVGARRSRSFIINRIASGAVILPEPTEKSGQVAMPRLRLSEGEVKSIADWLLTLPSK